MTTVAVLGGGVAGLSAAHELAERDFDVTVYESRDVFGGKARSMPVPGSGVGGRADLPAEHGFRFFPGFYRHVIDTMSRVPVGDTKADGHLAEATRIVMAQAGGRPEVISPTGLPTSVDDVRVLTKFIWDVGVQLSIPVAELGQFVEQLLSLLCACDERRLDQFERQSWWEFTGAEHRSQAFQKFLADGMTRTLVAARAHEMSARTGGQILCQLFLGMARIGFRTDRVLDGPTSEVWIDPWVEYLRGRGVSFQHGRAVSGIHCQGGRITGVTVGRGELVVADHYVAALPVERFRMLLSPELRAADRRLNGVDRLTTRWMNGAMFYLDRDVPLEHGHAIFIDSEWALTAISQQQFWKTDVSQRGNGRVEGILSVDISEWQRPGRRTGKVAMECSREEIRQEVWGQLTDAIDDGSLREENIVDWFLDPAIVFPNPCSTNNLEPLLINTVDSWKDRPEAATRIPNLVLAADYVRTNTDLATMEAANEAARRAVNAILDAVGSSAPRCEVWPMSEPAVLRPFRTLDRWRWRLNKRSVKPPLRVSQSGEVTPRTRTGRTLLTVSGKLPSRRR